jgi:hypothetical protein
MIAPFSPRADVRTTATLDLVATQVCGYVCQLSLNAKSNTSLFSTNARLSTGTSKPNNLGGFTELAVK